MTYTNWTQLLREVTTITFTMRIWGADWQRDVVSVYEQAEKARHKGECELLRRRLLQVLPAKVVKRAEWNLSDHSAWIDGFVFRISKQTGYIHISTTCPHCKGENWQPAVLTKESFGQAIDWLGDWLEHCDGTNWHNHIPWYRRIFGGSK